jgi:hypothetical protein
VLDTKSPKYLEMAQGHISLSARRPERRMSHRRVLPWHSPAEGNDGYQRAGAASSDVVKGLGRGTIVVKDANSGGGRKATSPVQVVEEQRGHNDLNPFATRSFHG